MTDERKDGMDKAREKRAQREKVKADKQGARTGVASGLKVVPGEGERPKTAATPKS